MRILSKVWTTLTREGPGVLLAKVRARLGGPDASHGSVVSFDDAQAVDWSTPHPAVVNLLKLPAGPLTVAWVMSPPGENSGGHQNIFRFLAFLEDAGHTVVIYLHSVHRAHSVAGVRAMLASSRSYPKLRATIQDYTTAGVAPDTHVIVATSWETAYPVFRDSSPARRLYFVQDFEPYFYPVGSESVLAENTYRFGFAAITAGGWLASKLATEFGMQTRSFEFSADQNDYSLVNTGPRTEIIFYARPATPRRGYALGIMALDLFAKARPDCHINLAGEDLRRHSIPFKHSNLGALSVSELNGVYNRCAAALVLSLTNMSLLPLELLASGTIPVVNDAPNNTMVSNNPFIEYTPASPRALAERLIEIVDRVDLPDHARRASESLGPDGWNESGRQFLAAFEHFVR